MAYEELVQALWAELPRARYATASEVDASSMPASIQVEGAGTMAFPLSDQDVDRLKNTPCVWSCPQFFSKVVVDLAVLAIKGLGIDAHALGLEVGLHKLVVHEKGDNFQLKSDTETKGLIATMILQLPTQSGHEGGELEVFHGDKSVSFDFSGANSCKGFFITLFLCDCELKLAQMKKGSGVYLVFGLVSDNVKYIDDFRRVPNYLSALGTVQKLLRDRAYDQSMLVIPLGHIYSDYSKNNSILFASLKGYDRVVAAHLLSCAGFLDVHLCMVRVRNERNDSIRTEYEMFNWKTLDDLKARYLENCNLDLKHFVSENYLVDFNYGNLYGASERAAVVLWPKGGEVKVLLEKLPKDVDIVKWLEEQHSQNPERTSRDLQRCVTALVHIRQFSALLALLKFCLRHDFRNDAFTILTKWALVLVATDDAEDRDMIFAVIEKYSWEECFRAENLQGVLEVPDLGMINLLSCPKLLAENGLQDAALYIAKELIKKRQDILSHWYCSIYMSCLLEFCISCELEEETWHLLSVMKTSQHSEGWLQCLTLVAKKWGEKSFSPIEQFCQRTSSSERPWGTWGKDTKTRNYLGKVAQLVWALERENCHDAAVHFAKRLDNAIDAVGIEEIYGKKDNNAIRGNDALVLLLRSEERFHKYVRQLSDSDIWKVICSIREAPRLFDVKRDAKARQIFDELLRREFEKHQEDRVFIRCEAEILEAMLWLGDETLMQNIAKIARDNPSITRCIVRNSDYLVGKLDDAGKNWLREALTTRIRYLSERACTEMEAGEQRQKKLKLDPYGAYKPSTFTSAKMERIEVDNLSFTLDKIGT